MYMFQAHVGVLQKGYDTLMSNCHSLNVSLPKTGLLSLTLTMFTVMVDGSLDLGTTPLSVTTTCSDE